MNKFRIGDISDIEHIRNIAWKTWFTTYHFLPTRQVEYMLQQFYSLGEIQRLITSGEQIFFVSQNGFSAVSCQDQSTWKLNKLYLLEEKRGKGEGKCLLGYSEQYAADNGADKIYLNVNRFNSTLFFYQKKGYKIQQEVDIPVGKYWMNDYVMVKRLK